MTECRQLELAELLARTPSAAERDHAAGCQRCAAVIAEAEALGGALAALRDDTARAAGAVDLSPALLAAIAGESESAPPRRRRWRWALAPALVAAVAAIAIAWPRAPSSVRVSSAGPLTAIRDGRESTVRGDRVELATPVRLIASASAGATIDVPGEAAGTVRLWPGARLSIATPSRFSDLSGGVSVDTGEPVTIDAADDISITGRGRFELEAGPKGFPMTLTRTHKITGGVVLVAVVATGWITVTTQRGAERLTAPAAAAVDDRGVVTRLTPPGSAGEAGSAVGADSTGAAGGDDRLPVSGAFWDEGEKRILFALAGEVLDAATGAPIAAFDVEAEPVESKGFGKVGSVKRSVTGGDNNRGDFVLNNLGLGTWRVTVRAEGYAPSTQRVDLGDLYANPVLLFPLTEGARITGQVVDWRGRPVEGAAVGQPSCHRRADPKCPLVKSDRDGRFDLPALPEEQTFALRAEHPRYGFSESRNLRQAPGETRHVVIQLSGIVRVTGRVGRGDASAPVAGAVVAAPDRAVTATTDAAGAYEMLVPLGERPEVFVVSDPARPDRPVKIASYPDNRSSREVRWVTADTHVAEVVIDFALQMERASISGRLATERGEPVAGARLRFLNTAGWKRGGRGHETFPTEAITGADGRYRVDDVPAEAGYRVHLMVDGQEPDDLGFVAVPSEIDVVADFVVGSGAIRGTFVDAAGQPFMVGGGCSRLGARSVDNLYHVARCVGDGRFEITGLTPGRYTLANRIPRQGDIVEITETEVEVGPGEVVEDVEVVVSGKEARRWRLRVLDTEGRFVAGAYSRYRIGTTGLTSSLHPGVDGVAEITVREDVETLFIDAAGYTSAALALKTLDPSEVIAVRLQRE